MLSIELLAPVTAPSLPRESTNAAEFMFDLADVEGANESERGLNLYRSDALRTALRHAKRLLCCRPVARNKATQGE